MRPTYAGRLARAAALPVAVALLATLGGPAAQAVEAAAEGEAVLTATTDIVGTPAVTQLLGDPFSAPRPSGVGSPTSPENDLDAALATLANAPDAAAAADARQRALDILEGNPVPDRAYSGIPLLNWNAPAKIKTVPAGGNVTVTEVRAGEHVWSDTWLLDFADPTLPFTITYRVAALDSTVGGTLAPAPLQVSGDTPAQSRQAVVYPLALPQKEIGTLQGNRFLAAPLPEITRSAVQEITVKMPAPGTVSAVLDPSLQPRGETLMTPVALTTLLKATAEQVAAAATPLDKVARIAQIGDTAPEKMLWTALQGLDPADPAFLDAAHTLGTDDRQLVAAMRVRNATPAGVVSDPAADLVLTLVNNETYVSSASVPAAGTRPITVQVVNNDAVPHQVSATALQNRAGVYGPTDWGVFGWEPLPQRVGATVVPGSEALPVPAGGQALVTLFPRPAAFALWLGDRTAGDQAGSVVSLLHGPDMQSVDFTRSGAPSWAHPIHAAVDPRGDIWVTLHGTDEIARVRPADDLAAAQVTRYRLPGGSAPGAILPLLAPQDIAVDERGIVWATLAEGSAIVRLDPAHVDDPATPDNTLPGRTTYPLPPCTPAECPPDPLAPTAPLTRLPEQMAVAPDGNGGTLVWFTELNSDRVGVLRVAADGAARGPVVEFPCQCTGPKGVDLGPDGSVWFTESANNRIGRLIPDQSRPFDPAAAVLGHIAVPSVDVQGRTSAPHSLVVDPAGTVWFTEEETGKVGTLDPTCTPLSSLCIQETALPPNDFGAGVSPADIAVDRSATAFWSDEYGDIVGSVRNGLPSTHWRPAQRQSLTDQPLLAPNGDLWFTEAGSNTLTRIRAASRAGNALPGPAPAYTFDLETASVHATGVADASTVDVSVVRDGRVVATALSVPVTSGGFAVGGAGHAWDTAPTAPTRPLRGGDTVRVQRHGAYPLAALSLPVATLAPVVSDGAVTGAATYAGKPLADHVVVTPEGGSAQDVGVDPATGVFRHTPAGDSLDAATSRGTVSWTGATTAGVFRTVGTYRPVTPVPTLVASPTSPTGDSTPTFGFAGPATTAGFECALQPLRTAYAPCAATTTLPALTDGAYTMSVRAVDIDGRRSGAVSQTFVVDTRAPIVSVPTTALAPGGASPSSLPVTVSWTARDPGSGVRSSRLQASPDGVRWSDVALRTPAATSAVVYLRPGVWRLRVAATDTLGHTSAWAGSAATLTAVQDSNRAIAWTGRWTPVTSTAAFGGTVRMATAAASARVTVTGRAVALVTTAGPDRGKVAVYVDGHRAAYLDLYAPTGRTRAIPYVLPMTPGTHVVQVYSLGSKNSASRGTRVDLDALAVLL